MLVFSITHFLFVLAGISLGVVTILSNYMVMIAVFRFKPAHTILDVFIANLAMSDIAVGIFEIICTILAIYGLPYSLLGCILVNCSMLIFANISILMLLAIFVERFIFTKSHITYHKYANIQTVTLISTYIWVLGSILGLVPLLLVGTRGNTLSSCAFMKVISLKFMVYFQGFGITFPSILLMILIYFYIVTSVISKRMEQSNSPQNVVFKETPDRCIRKQNEDERMAKMLGLLLFVCTVCWVPINIIYLLKYYCPTCPYPDNVLIPVAVILTHLNSAIHPFVYVICNSRIKKGIRRVMTDGDDGTNASSYNSEFANSVIAKHRPGSLDDHTTTATPNGILVTKKVKTDNK